MGPPPLTTLVKISQAEDEGRGKMLHVYILLTQQLTHTNSLACSLTPWKREGCEQGFEDAHAWTHWNRLMKVWQWSKGFHLGQVHVCRNERSATDSARKVESWDPNNVSNNILQRDLSKFYEVIKSFFFFLQSRFSFFFKAEECMKLTKHNFFDNSGL